MSRKIMALSLALIVLLSIVPVTLLANDTEAVQSYFVSVSASNPAWGSVHSSLQSAQPGSTVQITAEALTGFEFVRWEVSTGNLSLSHPDRDWNNFQMPYGDVAIMAIFGRQTAYNSVSVSVNNTALGTASSDHNTAVPGETVRLTATPSDLPEEHDIISVFERWEIQEGTAPGINLNNRNTSFTMPNSDVSIRAIFSQQEASSISVSANNPNWGQVSADHDLAIPGTTIRLTATPNNNHIFEAWEIISGTAPGINLNNRETTFTMPPSGNVSLRAVFAPQATDNTINLSTNNPDWGQVRATPQTAAPGATVRLLATPIASHSFERWEIILGTAPDLDTSASDTSFTMPSTGISIRAVFAPIAEAPTPTPSPTPGPQTTIRLQINNPVYTINNTPHTSDAAPFIDPTYNRTMVPLRVVAEALGAQVTWQNETRTVIIVRNTTTLSLPIGQPLPAGMGAPLLSNDRTFVPIAYIANTLGASTHWDEVNRAVYIQD